MLRNRTIAALASGTLVVEAAAHSGTVSGARAHSRSRPPGRRTLQVSRAK
ncbi:MAG TPA: DNA-processing protein DprA [Streptosporangiaceae bacterium]|nr:DNA-processing protein DprA [Streptosporangiaceae bacterium]